jgi:hypothetical protein
LLDVCDGFAEGRVLAADAFSAYDESTTSRSVAGDRKQKGNSLESSLDQAGPELRLMAAVGLRTEARQQMLKVKIMLAACGGSSPLPLLAQDVGRQQDGFYSGQSNGQVDLRADGCAPPKRSGQIQRDN